MQDTFTVAHLIARLQGIPLDTPVVLENNEYGIIEALNVETLKLVRRAENSDEYCYPMPYNRPETLITVVRIS